MAELKTYALICPGCGAGLKVGDAVDSFACTYCGASVRVERGEGIISLRLLTNAIANVQRGTDRTAAELALVRLPKEIEEQRRKLDTMGVRIDSLELDIARASRSSRSRKSTVSSQQRVRAIGVGIAFGLFFSIVLNLLLPTSVSAFAGLIVGVLVAIGYFRDPLRSIARNLADVDDMLDDARPQSTSEELKDLHQERRALAAGLQGLIGQLAAARAIVDQ